MSQGWKETTYVIVSPVKDEIRTVGETIECVLRQTRLPLEWVIVDDCSSDGTPEVLQAAAGRHSWIRPVRLVRERGRGFASVVEATQAGIDALYHTSFDFIALLDADLRFGADYFERLIRHFVQKPNLGLAGGLVLDPGESCSSRPRNRRDVPGATHFFRRRCLEEIGALVPIPEGGWDSVTCAMARMRGYDTELVSDLLVEHLRIRNAAQGGRVRRAWQFGTRDYAVGYGFLFESLKRLSRSRSPSTALTSSIAWLGYCAALFGRRKRVVPADVQRFIRAEHLARLRTSFMTLLPGE